MNKVLCIIGCLDVGGAETFLMKVFRTIDKFKYRLDFVVCTKKECAYNTDVKKLGGTIFIVTGKERNPLKNFFEIKKIVKENSYDSVMKISEYSIGAIDLLAAKYGGATRRIFRATNGGAIETKSKLLLHKILIPLANYVTTEKIAPSTEAAIFTFGKMAVEKQQVRILNNGLKLSDYIIDDICSDTLKEKLGLEGKYIVGHIGRMSKQKNHKFIIQVFSALLRKNKNAHLLLVGEGELYNAIYNDVKNRKIEKYVSFLGVRSDVPQLLSIIDVILFPSLYEGMPNVLVEAQAEGVPCVISTNITKEIKLTECISFLSLSDPIESWVETIEAVEKKDILVCQNSLKERGYDIEKVIKDFIDISFGTQI